MRYGIFFQLPVHSDQSDTVRFQETLDQIVYAEQLGYESAWLAESHFHPSFSAAPSPLVFLAAVSQRTTKIRLGTAGVLVPLQHPLRMAEDAATLDLLSRGRLELGVGRGSWSIQFSGLGVPMSQSDSRFEEGMIVLEKALRGGPIRHRGAHYAIDGISLTPRPVQSPTPPIRITAVSHRSTEWAAARGYPLLTGTVSHPMPEGLDAQLDVYRSTFRPGAGGETPEVSLIIPLYVGGSSASARSEFEPSLRQYLSVIGGQESWSYASTKMGIMGSPEEVSARSLKVIHEPDLVDFIGWFNVGGRVPHAQVMRAMERFAREVRPVLDASIDERNERNERKAGGSPSVRPSSRPPPQRSKRG